MEPHAPVLESALARSFSRKGQFLFTGSVTPHGPSGRVVTKLAEVSDEARAALRGSMLTDVPMERTLAQAWTIYSYLGGLLADQGCSFEDVLRQRLFFRDLRDVPVVERLMDHFYSSGRPATTIIEIPHQGIHDDISIQIDVVALVPDNEGLEKEIIEIPSLEAATRPYPQATKAGQFVFISNTVGVNPQTGELAASLEELEPEGKRFSDYPLRSRREEEILAQTWFIYQAFGKIMESQGGSVHDLVKVNGWLAYMMRDCEPMVVARESLYDSAQEMPASCSIGIAGLRPSGAHESYEAIGLVPQTEGFMREVRYEPSGLSPLTVAAVKAGPIIFTCGEVPVSVPRRMPITAFDELEDDGRLLGYGRIHSEARIQARAWYVLGEQRGYLERHGASFDDVVHQTVYMCNPQDYPALERVSTLFFGNRLPPTTLVPITDTSPFREAELEIEMIAIP